MRYASTCATPNSASINHQVLDVRYANDTHIFMCARVWVSFFVFCVSFLCIIPNLLNVMYYLTPASHTLLESNYDHKSCWHKHTDAHSQFDAFVACHSVQNFSFDELVNTFGQNHNNKCHINGHSRALANKYAVLHSSSWLLTHTYVSIADEMAIAHAHVDDLDFRRRWTLVQLMMPAIQP